MPNFLAPTQLSGQPGALIGDTQIAALPGSWTPAASMAEPRSYYTATLLDNGLGGGVFNGGPSPVGTPSQTLDRGLVVFNRADCGAASAGGVAGLGVGGGVYVVPGGTVVADHTRIKHNHASTSNDDEFGDLG
jgi:hypothetical protein